MKTHKSYGIEFIATSANKDQGTHPSSAAVASAIENALRYIGLEPKASRVNGSAEMLANGDPAVQTVHVSIETEEAEHAKEDREEETRQAAARVAEVRASALRHRDEG